MRSGSRCPAFYGEIPPMRWGILNDDGGYFYCITYKYAGLEIRSLFLLLQAHALDAVRRQVAGSLTLLE